MPKPDFTFTDEEKAQLKNSLNALINPQRNHNNDIIDLSMKILNVGICVSYIIQEKTESIEFGAEDTLSCCEQNQEWIKNNCREFCDVNQEYIAFILNEIIDRLSLESSANFLYNSTQFLLGIINIHGVQSQHNEQPSSQSTEEALKIINSGYLDVLTMNHWKNNLLNKLRITIESSQNNASNKPSISSVLEKIDSSIQEPNNEQVIKNLEFIELSLDTNASNYHQTIIDDAKKSLQDLKDFYNHLSIKKAEIKHITSILKTNLIQCYDNLIQNNEIADERSKLMFEKIIEKIGQLRSAIDNNSKNITTTEKLSELVKEFKTAIEDIISEYRSTKASDSDFFQEIMNCFNNFFASIANLFKFFGSEQTLKTSQNDTEQNATLSISNKKCGFFDASLNFAEKLTASSIESMS